MDTSPFILDGGLATELEASGFQLQGDPLWSARRLHTNPQAIKDVHYRWKTEKLTSFAKLSLDWKEQGALWIGGCCRVGPADITEL